MRPNKDKSPASNRVRATIGDVFQFRVDGRGYGFGQIVCKGRLLYVALFQGIHETPPRPPDVVRNEIALVAWTTDAWLFHRRWTIIGNTEPPESRIPFPSYKVEIDGEIYACAFNGKDCRLATNKEVELLQYKKSFTPAVLHSAFQAFHGLELWKPGYDSLKAEFAFKRVIDVN